jgi:hypothetical protein
MKRYFKKIMPAYFLVWLSILVVTSCKPKMGEVNVTPKENSSGVRKMVASYKVQAAKILAKAVNEEGVRKLIKDEALKKFNGDYDVLFQLVQGKAVKNKKTLYSVLEELADSPEEFKKISDNLPLLTIYVPTFFSAEKWNTATQVPIVAVRDEEDRLIAFNDKGESVELSPKEEPNIPIVVVKLNDRVTTKKPDTKSANGQTASNNFLFDNGRNSFYFIDESVNNLTPKSKGGRTAFYDSGIDPVVKDAYNRSIGCGNCYQKDWIYYGINPASGQNSGPLSYKFKEAITEIEPTNTALLDAMGGWDEGAFVIVVNAMFGSRTLTTKESISKNIPVNSEDLFTYREEIRHRGIFGINTYIVRIVEGVKPYRTPDPVTFDTWDMEEYGDKWTLVAEEYDQETEETKSYRDTNKFGFNFSVNAGSKEKLGASLGATGDFSKETIITYKTTNINDALGQAYVRYTDPVITGSGVLPFSSIFYSTTYQATTGSLNISFETVRTAP